MTYDIMLNSNPKFQNKIEKNKKVRFAVFNSDSNLHFT